MIICPNCQHKNLDGTVFCGECGMQLSGIQPIVTQNISAESRPFPPMEKRKTAPFTDDLETWASLHLLDSGQIHPGSCQRSATDHAGYRSHPLSGLCKRCFTLACSVETGWPASLCHGSGIVERNILKRQTPGTECRSNAESWRYACSG